MPPTWEECDDPQELLRRSRQHLKQERFRWLAAEYVERMRYRGYYCEEIGEFWTKGFVAWVRDQGPLPIDAHDPGGDFDYTTYRPRSDADIAKDLIVHRIHTRDWAQLAFDSWTILVDEATRYEPMISETHKPKSKTKLANLKVQEKARYQAWRESLDVRLLAIKEAFCNSFRDVAGDPFHPVIYDPRWRTDTVMALARGIHAEAAFDRMPILADALEEAGCDHPAILQHCRSQQQHTRGCWVIAELFEDQWDSIALI
jgi:hypothetical protein